MHMHMCMCMCMWGVGAGQARSGVGWEGTCLAVRQRDTPLALGGLVDLGQPLTLPRLPASRYVPEQLVVVAHAQHHSLAQNRACVSRQPLACL